MLDNAMVDVPAEIANSGAPMVPETDVPTCEVCGGDEFRVSAEGFDYELITCRNRWRFVTCRRCAHTWLNPRPDASALSTIYPSSYYAYNYDQISPVARRGKEYLDSRKMAAVLTKHGGRVMDYLDVGCGDGRYLEVLARQGVSREHLYGLELDQTTVDRLRERGLQAHCERVETCTQFAPNSLDLITIFHVIEHVDSPRQVVAKLAEWLRPGGVLALETPNIESLDARLFSEGMWGGYHIPRHWHLFHPDGLRQLLTEAGLHVEEIRYETGHSFWMYSMHHRLRYGPRPRPGLARWFDPLSSLLPLVAFTGFDKTRSILGAKTSAMLAIARK
jgi:2-polyprenyl-3-methyl-5-hydroxy-6-metoxy-1,4-benzoquinol methylase